LIPHQALLGEDIKGTNVHDDLQVDRVDTMSQAIIGGADHVMSACAVAASCPRVLRAFDSEPSSHTGEIVIALVAGE
jgi:hypothetical protein